MQSAHKNRLQMFRRVRNLLEEYRDTPALTGAVAELDGIIERLAQFGTQQDASERRARSLTQDIRDRSRQLREEFMRPVVLLGRRVIPSGAITASNPRGLTLPDGRDYEGMVTAAHGLADAVEVHDQRLVAAGLPKDHLTRMRAAADALRTLVDSRAHDRGKRVAATTGAVQEAIHGLTVVKLLNALLLTILRRNPAKLAEWRSAMRMTRTGGGGVVVTPAAGSGGDGATGTPVAPITTEVSVVPARDDGEPSARAA